MTPKDNLKVMDFPKMRQKPYYHELAEILDRLKLRPSSFNGPLMEEEQNEDIKAISTYLTSIISSPLAWFSNVAAEEVAAGRRERIWDEASKRLAERCGRSAMPEMTRTWVIPPSLTCPEICLNIREPPLTGDNLGLKTWGTAYFIAKKLEWFGSTCLNHLIHPGNNNPKLAVLELGSGTGLVGIATAAIWGCSVTVTDLPIIQQNLYTNVQQNQPTVHGRGGSLVCKALDWRDPPADLDRYELLIAADPLYDDEHPDLIAKMITKYQLLNNNSRALVAVPLRDDKTSELVASFRSLMLKYGHNLLHEGVEVFFDDWKGTENDGGVKCWWGIFKWEGV